MPPVSHFETIVGLLSVTGLGGVWVFVRSLVRGIDSVKENSAAVLKLTTAVTSLDKRMSVIETKIEANTLGRETDGSKTGKSSGHRGRRGHAR